MGAKNWYIFILMNTEICVASNAPLYIFMYVDTCYAYINIIHIRHTFGDETEIEETLILLSEKITFFGKLMKIF